MRSTIALALLFVAVAHAQSTGTFGTKVMCSASSGTTFNFAMPVGMLAGNLQVQATCSGSATGGWTLNTQSSFGASWNALVSNGFQAFSLSGSLTSNVGLSLAVDANVDLTLTITSPNLGIAFQALIALITGATVTANAGVVQFDATGNAQVVIPATLVNVNTQLQYTFTVQGEQSGTTYTYLPVALNLVAQAQAAFGANFTYIANSNQTYAFYDTTAMKSKASVLLMAQASGWIQCSESSTPTQQPPASMGTFIKTYLTFHSYNSNGNLNFNGNAQISYNYDATDLTNAGIATANQANLAFAYFDETAQAWVKAPQTSVNVNAQVVVASTTHFSQWAVYATNAATLLNANYLLMVLLALCAFTLA